MKKLLTIILPTLALTTGAPMAGAQAGGGECDTIIVEMCATAEQRGAYPVFVWAIGQPPEGSSFRGKAFAFFPSYGADREEAVRLALADCGKRNWAGGEKMVCEIGGQTTAPGCFHAVGKEYEQKTAWGVGMADSRQASIDKAKADCRTRAPTQQVEEAEAEEDKPRYGAYAEGTRDGEKMAYALAVGYETQAEADAAAVEMCDNNPGFPGCSAVSVIGAPCAAVAKVNEGQDAGQVDRSGWDPGIGAGEDEAGAIETAISECQAQPKIGEGILYCSKHSAVCSDGGDPASIRAMLHKPGEEAVRDLAGYMRNLVSETAPPSNKEETEITETFNEKIPEIFKHMSWLYGSKIIETTE